MKQRDDIIKAAEYVREHVAEDINTIILAEMTFLSRFHFHRLFNAQMGMTAARYIRAQKLRAGLFMLLATGAPVTDIAYGLGFHSHDVFTRAFKRQYGETPSGMRAVIAANRWMMACHPFAKRKGDACMLEWLYENPLLFTVSFTTNDKRDCLSTVELIIRLSEIARREGLLALADTVNRESDCLFFKKGIALVCDGLKQEQVSNILRNYLFSTGYKGAELLKRVLIVEGISSIQSGDSPNIVRERLLSVLGEGFHDEACLYLGIGRNVLDDGIIEKYFAESDIDHYPAGTNLLEDMFLPLDNRTLQLILRETDMDIFIPSFRGSSKKLQKRLTDNLGTALAVNVINKCRFDPAPNKDVVVKAQHVMLSIYHKVLSGRVNL